MRQNLSTISINESKENLVIIKTIIILLIFLIMFDNF